VALTVDLVVVVVVVKLVPMIDLVVMHLLIFVFLSCGANYVFGLCLLLLDYVI
jgi:hypothetical protein